MNADAAPEPVPERKKGRGWGRVLDVLAVLVIAGVAWKLFIAPRTMSKAPDAYPVPRVSYDRLGGGTFSPSDAKGKVLFLDFFATWCEPCRLEMPLVEHYAHEHPEVQVVAIDVGEPPSLVAPFAKKFKLHDVALDPQTRSSGLFQIDGFPTVVVIDPQSRIRATWTGFNPAIEMAMSHAVDTVGKN